MVTTTVNDHLKTVYKAINKIGQSENPASQADILQSAKGHLTELQAQAASLSKHYRLPEDEDDEEYDLDRPSQVTVFSSSPSPPPSKEKKARGKVLHLSPSHASLLTTPHQ